MRLDQLSFTLAPEERTALERLTQLHAEEERRAGRDPDLVLGAQLRRLIQKAANEANLGIAFTPITPNVRLARSRAARAS